MKALVAIDSFKGALSSLDAGSAAAKGIVRACSAQVQVCAVADGGEGSVDALAAHKQGHFQPFACLNAFHQPIEVNVFLFEEAGVRCAALEAASVFGLHDHAVSARTVEETSTFGLGILMKALIEANVQRLLFFLGGTITTDAGLGMLQGLGAILCDEKGHVLASTTNPLLSFDHWDAASLQQVRERCAQLEIIVACDVNAPLYGETGCAMVYAPQKGATPRQQLLLDRKLRRLEEVSGMDLMQEGCGAGGGCGAGMRLLGARLTSGFALLSESLSLADQIAAADIVVTGEGGINAQSLQGKLPVCVAQLAHQAGKPVLALCGQKEIDAALSAQFDGIFSIQQGVSTLKEAIDHTAEHLEESAYQLFRLICRITHE